MRPGFEVHTVLLRPSSSALPGVRSTGASRCYALLKTYSSQVLQWFDDIRTLLVGDVLLRWPTLEAVQQVRPATLEKFLHEHNSVRKKTLAHRSAAIKAAVPLTTAQAVLHSCAGMITACATPRQPPIKALRDFDREMAPLCRMHAASPLCASLPGAGAVYAARLTAALGTARDRGTTGEAWRRCSGVAPVLARRGQSTWMRWRSFWPTFLRQACHEDAGESMHHAFWAKASSLAQRARGKRHPAAVRALACKGMRIS